MTLRDIINSVDKTKAHKQLVDVCEMADEMYIDNFINFESQDRLVSYYVANWYCTDSMVGYRVFFFDNEAVAFGIKKGRKAYEDIKWISKEAYQKVKEYVLTFTEPKEDNIDLLDLDLESLDVYKVEFYEQMYDHHKENAIYNKDGISHKVKIAEFKDGYHDEKMKYHPETVKILFESGDTKWIEPKKLDFPYLVSEIKLEGASVLVIKGDRDYVGCVAKVEDIQPDGSCKINFGSEYMYDNINNIELDVLKRNTTECDLIIIRK